MVACRGFPRRAQSERLAWGALSGCVRPARVNVMSVVGVEDRASEQCSMGRARPVVLDSQDLEFRGYA